MPFTIDDATTRRGPPWLRAHRGDAFERFNATPLPTEADEEWRYSRIADLHLEHWSSLSHGPGSLTAGDPADGTGADAPDPADGTRGAVVGGAAAGGSTVAMVLAALQGAVVVEVDDAGATVSGSHPAVTITDLGAEGSGARPLGDLAGEPDALVSLNSALAPTPVVIDVARGADGTVPTVVVVHRAVATGTSFPRLAVRVAADADASVVEVMAGDDVECLVVPVTELDVGDAARLSYVQLQLLGPRCWQIGLQASRVGRDATLTSASVSLGGDYGRLRTDSALVGQGGTSKLLAVYFAGGTQVHDLRTVQAHRAPRATSDLYFKGAVANRSRSVYTGLIRVDKGAVGTNAFQTNRNLVLHEGAHADSVPNLEIEDNDVRCSHASSVGPIAEDQRFYLESRGVPTDVADRLIALGFLNEVLDRLPVPGLRAPLQLALVAKLDAAERREAELAGVGA